MEKDLISVIVPVYNIEKYLPRCIDSILDQTYKNWEAIFINDGSTDNSLKILEEYKKRDERIKIIDKKNAGSGAARNDGIETSKGKYIAFLDSDDWYEEDFLEKLYNNLIENSSDVSMCNPKMTYDNINKNKKINTYFFNEIELNKTPEKILGILAMPVVWNKLYKKDIIVKNRIKFPNYSFCEDVEFLYKTFLYANKVSKIEDDLYNYYQREDSETKKIKEESIEQVYKVIKNIENYVKENFIEKLEIFYQYKIQFLYSISQILLLRTNSDKRLKKLVNKNNNLMVKNIKLKKISKNKKILVYYTAIKLNKVLEISKIISLLRR
ncbi:glycosyltransferase [Fusobacterium sp.]|uniref:glycosyltransferase family 2 protein n=1 Tax=Fusobacterium sp. TaxID=68766 RepID=UPI0025F2ED15|nr:glycosyltransferase [Fusobacterium sp.]MDY3060767.1 glycosyltransferase [Fusobacterium sp.]